MLEIINEGSIEHLPRFFSRLDVRDFELEIWIDIRADDVIRYEKLIRKCLEACGNKNLRLVVCTIGFENFVQRHLDIYNKGTTVEDNLKALSILRKIKKEYGNKFRFDTLGGGIVLFNPWVTLEDIEKNINTIYKSGLYELFGFPIISLTVLKCFRGTAIYEKAKQEGLLKDEGYKFMAPWRFKDKDAELFYKLIRRTSSEMIKGKLYDKWADFNKREVLNALDIIRTIKKNRGASPYMLERLCLRNLRDTASST